MKLKKSILTAVILCIVFSTAMLAVGCDSNFTAKQLFGDKLDFSVEKVKQIGETGFDDGGNHYGNETVLAVNSGDARLEVLCKAWKEFYSEATFVKTNKKRKLFVTGHDRRYVVIFTDGSSVNITEICKYKDNTIVRIKDERYLVNTSIFDKLEQAHKVITPDDKIQ